MIYVHGSANIYVLVFLIFHKLVLLTFCNLHIACVSAEVVCLDRSLLLFHQLCKLQKLRGHQTDDEQFHVSTQHHVFFDHFVHRKALSVLTQKL